MRRFRSSTKKARKQLEEQDFNTPDIGERSPYREWIQQKGFVGEPEAANPDSLQDRPENSPFGRFPLSELAQETIENLRPFMNERGELPILSRRENQVFQLYVIGGFQREQVQTELKLKRTSVDTYLERIGRKLRTLLNSR